MNIFLVASADFKNDQDAKKQAQALARRLSKEKINFIYSSDCQSSKKTVNEFADMRDELSLVLTRDLQSQQKQESVDDFKIRVEKFWKGLFKKHAQETVVIMACRDSLSMILSVLNSKSDESFNKKIKQPLAHASLTEIQIDSSGEVKIKLYNDQTHLTNA